MAAMTRSDLTAQPTFPLYKADALLVRNGRKHSTSRIVPEEVAVSLTYNRVSHAVMMATPSALQDFALGFSLTEGIVTHPNDIETLDVVHVPDGIELRMWLHQDVWRVLADRRRRQVGPTGCGLCGLDSLQQAMRTPPPVGAGLAVTAGSVAAAVARMTAAQPLNQQARALHAAGWAHADGTLTVREDVGRHNALDKLVGALAQQPALAADGLLVLTSRVSVELVQKAAMAGFTTMIAVSAPTALAIRTADAAGITLVGIARQDAFEIFSHPERILDPQALAG